MNELLTQAQMEHLRAENERLRAALAELEKTLLWVTKQLKEMTQ